MFFEEIRAGREEGGIHMHEVEALNSGKNQTVKSSFAEERSNIFFLVQNRAQRGFSKEVFGHIVIRNSANKIYTWLALVSEGRRSRGKHGRASHKVLVFSWSESS